MIYITSEIKKNANNDIILNIENTNTNEIDKIGRLSM